MYFGLLNPYQMRSRTLPLKPDDLIPQTSTENFTRKQDAVPSVQTTQDSSGDESEGTVKEKYSRKIILVVTALAITLSIGSMHWMAQRRTAPPQTTEALIPEKQKITTIGEKEKAEEERMKEPVKAVVESEDVAKKFRKNWKKYITATHSNYAYGVLGGINDLSVVFTNKTDFAIDEMKAELTYIKNNGKPWKAKYVSVFNIPPHSEKRKELPKVNRGKTVEINISKIVSSEMHFFYTPGKSSKDPDDPYFMQ